MDEQHEPLADWARRREQRRAAEKFPIMCWRDQEYATIAATALLLLATARLAALRLPPTCRTPDTSAPHTGPHGTA
ncbi:hypothetical protein [Streptomyces sp. NPDC002187]|uniref:hypothetical protein n=1 Tax=Streptomyces sp. NPDC002187 TaxID=3364637 RepID=UPI00368EDAB7